MQPDSISRTFALFADEVRYADLPGDVREHASLAMLNWLGCVYGGCREKVVDAAIEGLGPHRHGSSALIGRGAGASPVDAALVNCLSSSVHAFDDTHLPTIMHPTGPVAAACVAVAEHTDLPREAFDTALVVGMEVECRLAHVLLSAEPAAGGASPGWLMTGVAGGVGAAVAASMLLDSTPGEAAAAIGLAAAQAGGFRSAHGSMAMPLIPALAARNGLQAALWARAGMSCNEQLIDGENGLLDVLAPGVDAALACSGLGTDFLVLENTFKPYPCGIVIHPVIDACLDALARHAITPDDVAHVDIVVHPIGKRLADRPNPMVAFQAQVSLQFCVAATLSCGRFCLEQLTEEWFNRPDLLELQRNMSVIADPQLGRDAARLHIRLKSGTQLEVTVNHATGSQANPMSLAALVDKFGSQADPVLGPAKSHRLVELLFAGTTSMRDIWSLVGPVGAAKLPGSARPMEVQT